MTRRYFAILPCVAVAFAQQQQKPPEAKPQEQEPPEEDESLKPKQEYTFNPLQAESELKIGNFYFKKGSYRAAAKRFEEATRWNPNFAEAFLRWGEALEKLRDVKTAKSAYEKYIALAPDAKNAAAIRKKIGEKP